MALDYAVNKIKQAIPAEVLEKTFIDVVPRFRSVRSAVSVDALIKMRVVRDIVLTDCNLIGANEIDIAIHPGWCQHIDQNQFVVRVPKAFTQNRMITEVMSCNFMPQGGYATPYGNQSPISETTLGIQKLMTSLKQVSIVSTANTEVIGENTIVVTGTGAYSRNMFLTVMVEHDDQMSKLRRQAYPIFVELCILAAKSYIWSNRVIDMDKAEIAGGYTLNRFTSIVEGYEGAFEEYTEFFNTRWKKTSFVGDPARNKKYIDMITTLGIP